MDLEFVYMNYIGNILVVGNVSDVLGNVSDVLLKFQ